MKAYHTAAHLLNSVLHRFGLHISRAGGAPDSLTAAFHRLKPKAITVATVIDVGASNGSWSDLVRPFYPNAEYLLIEANPVHQAALEAYTTKRANTRYVLAAAGDRTGEVFFDGKDPFGGTASVTPKPGFNPVPVVTIDGEIQRLGLPGPYLIKLDTHGFEVPILEGAAQTLTQTDMLVIEAYNFQLQPESLRFPQMCLWLENHGFRPIDFVEPVRRPYDNAFWQFDLIFVRADRREFAYVNYQ